MFRSENKAARASRAGFSLMELMVVVAILGVLAALALPALTGYARTAKTGEATTNLNNIFKTAASFYVQEQAAQGLTGNINTNCIVQDAPRAPTIPLNKKQSFQPPSGGAFRTLGFTIGDAVYYSYGITSIATNPIECGYSGVNLSLYTFYANGDLDSDGIESTFLMPTGSDVQNTLYHSRGIYINLPIE